MNELQRTGFAERLKTAADARKALLAGFRPKPSSAPADFQPRAVTRAAELAGSQGPRRGQGRPSASCSRRDGGPSPRG